MTNNINNNTVSKVISCILIIPVTILAVITSSWIGLISLMLFLYLNTLIHELGHLLAGKLVGFKHFTVFLGYGKEIFRIKIMDTTFVIQTGSGGLTGAAKYGKKFLQLRLFIYFFGGIFLNGLIVFLVILIYGIDIELDKINIPVIFAASNLYFIIISILPINIYKNDTKISNDGLKLLKILFMKEQVLSEIYLSEEAYSAYELLKGREFDLALAKYADLVIKSPKSVSISINYSTCLMKCLRFEDARKILFESMDYNKDNKLDLIMKNNIAWLYLLELNNEFLTPADKFSDEACSGDPDNSNYQNTRAFSLIQSGRIDEGIQILTRMIKLGDPIDKKKNNIMNFIFLAYGYLLKGELNEVNTYLEPINNYINDLDPEELFLYERLKLKTNNFNDAMNTNCSC